MFNDNGEDNLVLKPEDYASDEDKVRAARMALAVADTAEEAALHLAALDIDPRWVKSYVAQHGWPAGLSSTFDDRMERGA